MSAIPSFENNYFNNIEQNECEVIVIGKKNGSNIIDSYSITLEKLKKANKKNPLFLLKDDDPAYSIQTSSSTDKKVFTKRDIKKAINSNHTDDKTKLKFFKTFPELVEKDCLIETIEKLIKLIQEKKINKKNTETIEKDLFSFLQILINRNDFHEIINSTTTNALIKLELIKKFPDLFQSPYDFIKSCIVNEIKTTYLKEADWTINNRKSKNLDILLMELEKHVSIEEILNDPETDVEIKILIAQRSIFFVEEKLKLEKTEKKLKILEELRLLEELKMLKELQPSKELDELKESHSLERLEKLGILEELKKLEGLKKRIESEEIEEIEESLKELKELLKLIESEELKETEKLEAFFYEMKKVIKKELKKEMIDIEKLEMILYRLQGVSSGHGFNLFKELISSLIEELSYDSVILLINSAPPIYFNTITRYDPKLAQNIEKIRHPKKIQSRKEVDKTINNLLKNIDRPYFKI